LLYIIYYVIDRYIVYSSRILFYSFTMIITHKVHVNVFGFGLCVVVVIGICVVVFCGGGNIVVVVVCGVGNIAVVVELITIYDVLRSRVIANSALGFSHLILLNVFGCFVCSISVLFCSHKYHNKIILYLHNILYVMDILYTL